MKYDPRCMLRNLPCVPFRLKHNIFAKETRLLTMDLSKEKRSGRNDTMDFCQNCTKSASTFPQNQWEWAESEHARVLEYLRAICEIESYLKMSSDYAESWDTVFFRLRWEVSRTTATMPMGLPLASFSNEAMTYA